MGWMDGRQPSEAAVIARMPDGVVASVRSTRALRGLIRVALHEAGGWDHSGAFADRYGEAAAEIMDDATLWRLHGLLGLDSSGPLRVAASRTLAPTTDLSALAHGYMVVLLGMIAEAIVDAAWDVEQVAYRWRP